MIAKTGTGKSFKGLTAYLQDEMKNGFVLDSDGVRITTPQAMAFDFHQQAKNNERTIKSVGHDSLSFALNDRKLSDEEMKTIARAYMDKMGYQETQYVIVRHQDRPHQHCHIVYNRVNNEGNTITDKFNYLRANRICRELEQHYGLEQVDGTLKSKKERKERDKNGLKSKIARLANLERIDLDLKESISPTQERDEHNENTLRR